MKLISKLLALFTILALFFSTIALSSPVINEGDNLIERDDTDFKVDDVDLDVEHDKRDLSKRDKSYRTRTYGECKNSCDSDRYRYSYWTRSTNYCYCTNTRGKTRGPE